MTLESAFRAKTRYGIAPLLGILTILFLGVTYRAAVDVPHTLSPQGCRMSWMYPSYVRQDVFKTRRLPPGNRYSLWLYREGGWDPESQIRGVPVLFIPGNAGSSEQVRSIASSASRQYYSSPGVVSPEFESRMLKPLDVFAVDFDEDLSALHGPTLDYQFAYTSDAISYILSLYPPKTSIIVIGHSMGGIVATMLLPSPNISAIFTLSTPHTLPPARFDTRIDKIYAYNHQKLLSDPTSIISLCGGATDSMINSESCILPPLPPYVNNALQAEIYRRTVFTSGLEGAWTGVGHREMVWCHQVRWRIARVALELGAVSVTEKGLVLDKWLRDGYKLPPELEPVDDIPLMAPGTYETLPAATHLVLRNPRGSRMYLIPVVASSSPAAFVLFLSQGTVGPIAPQNPLPLRALVYLCTNDSDDNEHPPECRTLPPTTLKLVPNPEPEKEFPVPNEGADESEGVVVYEAEVLPPTSADTRRWIGVLVSGGEGGGWVVAGMNAQEDITLHSSILSPIFSSVSLPVPDPHALRTRIHFPNVWSSALVVYRLRPKTNQFVSACPDRLLSPILVHTSFPPETHYFPLANLSSYPLLLHSHNSAPFIPKQRLEQSRGLNLTIYTSGCESELPSFDLSIDWLATLGRLATRYWTTLVCWAIGVVALTIFWAWKKGDQGLTPSVSESLKVFATTTLPPALLVSFAISLLPLPKQYYLGGGGEPMLAPIAPLLLLLATGLGVVSWWMLVTLLWSIAKLRTVVLGNVHNTGDGRKGRISICVVLVFALAFVPWQVVFLGSWIIHLYTCATQYGRRTSTSTHVSTYPRTVTVPSQSGHDQSCLQTDEKFERNVPTWRIDNEHHNQHMLFLMTWILPLVSPVLVIWARTLLRSGPTTPFETDYSFFGVAPFLILVLRANNEMYRQHRLKGSLSVRWSFVALAVTAFFIGPVKPYTIVYVARVCVCLALVLRLRVVHSESRQRI